ncbi:MAG: inositol monophosphatase [Propioniciclava sp.]|uniref:inositol monophosphatase family protein n=1 Tax=Propioniciclava sp. TaxID=2038686 RepID=UPI0039E327AA
MKTEDVSALIADVCERLILPRFQALTESEIIYKRPGDLVTVADREAEAALARALHASAPEALVVGEEAVFGRPGLLRGLAEADHAWVIDPIDGTRNFVAGNPDFAVMVAEIRAGQTRRGWIWQPLHQALYVAELGAGVEHNGTPMAPLAEPTRPWQVAVWPRGAGQRVAGADLRPTRGSCAIDYPALLRGELDGLAYRSLNPWDHLPGVLMVTELGGTALADGQPYTAAAKGRLLAIGATAEVAEALGRDLRP